MVGSEKGSPAFSSELKREGICVFVQDAGALGKKLKDGVKLLGQGSGNFSLPLQIEVMISSIWFCFITCDINLSHWKSLHKFRKDGSLYLALTAANCFTSLYTVPCFISNYHDFIKYIPKWPFVAGVSIG